MINKYNRFFKKGKKKTLYECIIYNVVSIPPYVS